MGWKAIPEDNPVEIDFNGESLLIHGPNESGKSSLFSALRFALFERHDAKGEWTRGWVNNQSNQMTVTVELMINGVPYTITKSRKGAAAPRGTKTESKLFEGVGTLREDSLISQGVDADTEVIRLIGAAQRSGRADEIPNDWGLLAWLLAPQGMDSVSSAREHGTQSLGLERAISPDLTKVKLNLHENLKGELSTVTRDPKTGGRLSHAIEIHDEAEEDCIALNNRMELHMRLLQELHRIEADIVRKEHELEEAREEEDRIRGQDVDTASLEGKVEAAESRVAESTRLRDNCQERYGGIQTIIRDRDSHDKDAREATKVLATATVKKNRIKLELDASKNERKSLDSRLREIKISVNSLLTLKNRIRDQAEREHLGANLKRAMEIETEMTALTIDSPILSQEAIDELEVLEQELRIADITIEALANQGSTLQIDGDIDAALILDGEEESRQDEMSFGRRLEIRGDEFCIRVNNSSSDDDYFDNRTEIIEQLESLGIESYDELISKIEVERPRTLMEGKFRRESLELGTSVDIKTKLESITDPELTEDELEHAPRIEDEIEALNSEEVEKTPRFSELDTEIIDLEKKIIKSRDDISANENLEKAAFALRDDADKRLRKEIEVHGDLKSRKNNLNDAEKTLKKAQLELKSLTDQLEQTVASRSSEFKRANRNKRAKEDELNILRAKHLARHDEAISLAGENLQSSIVRAEQHLDSSNLQLTVTKRRVDSMERLRLRIENRITEATDGETAPIRDKVQIWLRTVTEDRWHEVEMDSKLNVTRVSGPGHMGIDGESFGSHGLQQVIHALIRLAVACNIYEDRSAEDADFPPVALVMDESQSHVDDRRVSLLMERFNREIDEGKVQIIALSHRATEFRNLEAREYDVESRSIRDLRDDG
jgi:chromosome segregation ATPase